MISKARIKWLNTLAHKKFRDTQNVFTAEGERLVRDLIPHFKVRFLAAKRSWIDTYGQVFDSLKCEKAEVTAEEMHKITQLSTPSTVLCVMERKKEVSIDEASKNNDLIIALDRVQDPGNLGTILRTADWFGVRHVLCSEETADVYNPKVIQSTMGALARVNIIYCDLAETLSGLRKCGWCVNGTFLDGKNIYESELKHAKSVIVMGNEGNGISNEIEAMVDTRLTIPSYPSGQATSESLNVAMATGIILSEFRRNKTH